MQSKNHRWLVVGGAGYIGAHLLRNFLEHNRSVIVIDDLSTGKIERLPEGVEFFQASIKDVAILTDIILKTAPDGIVQLAARKQARESVRRPLEYWQSNVGGMLGLIQAVSSARMKGHSVRNFILSSSCAVYGASGFVTEETAVAPVSPYGKTKVVSEQVLFDVAPSLGLNWISLRYFNVIGNASFQGAHDSSEETLIPSVSRACKNGVNPVIFGNDFSTEDGTCVRDYIDVRDLSRAHLLAAKYLERANSKVALNLNVGIEKPRSVLEVVKEIQLAMNSDLPIDFASANVGDPPSVWSSSNMAHQILDWYPIYSLRDSVKAHVDSLSKSDSTPIQ